MARVTVEDCITEVPNRFKLVMLASQRARDIQSGSSITVERDNDKNPVVALREIAGKTVDLDELEEELIQGLQKIVEHDEIEDFEEDEMDLLAIQQEMNPDMIHSENSEGETSVEITIGSSEQEIASDLAGEVFGSVAAEDTPEDAAKAPTEDDQ